MSHMNPMNILIVDDSSPARQILGGALRRVPVEIELLQAANGVEALAIVEQNRVDLIFCDICMPEMDGLEFLRKLRGAEKTKDLPVVIITARPTDNNVAEALSQGVQGILRKPFTPQDVKASVTSLVDIATL